MKLAALFSGGKDSTFAIYKAIQLGHEITQLISFKSENPYSYMFHYQNIDLTKTQAERMNIPIKIIKTKGEKETELKDIKKSLQGIKIDGVVSGAIASNYQKERIEKICEDLHLKNITPLWHIDQEQYMQTLLDNNFKVMITSVSCDEMDKSWLGRIIDKKCLDDLKILQKQNKMNISGEGGEYCTTVLDCPLFSKEIKIKKSKTVWEGDRGLYLIQEAE